jgi:predicted ABC-type ATPase
VTYLNWEKLKKPCERKFRTYLYFVCLDDLRINISRVEIRKEKGGHGGPQDKIIDRYYLTLTNLLPAIKACEKAHLLSYTRMKCSLKPKSLRLKFFERRLFVKIGLAVVNSCFY